MTSSLPPSAQVAPVKPADLTGPYGRAWKVSHPDEGTPDYAASIGSYLIEQPSGHPFWRFHGLGAVHLREQDGVEPPKLHFPAATHEFICLALDPGKPIPVVDRWEKAPFMMPPDFVRQVVLPRDEDAAEMLTLIARYSIEVGLALDSDTRSAWDSIINTTAGHYAPGNPHGA